jgi:hypothetical protein
MTDYSPCVSNVLSVFVRAARIVPPGGFRLCRHEADSRFQHVVRFGPQERVRVT